MGEKPVSLSGLLIAGPTASGKSSLAVRLAQKLNGLVINADSMQIYDKLHILTARPDDEEMAGVEHLLFGYVDPSIRYSVGHWLDDCIEAIRVAKEKGSVPILVGGTGLYFKALIEGLNDMPEIPPAIRDYWAKKQEELVSPQALHQLLTDRDPAMAEMLNPADSQRVLRALEILDATGKSLLDWQASSAMRHDTGIAKDFVRLVLLPPRDLVYQKIEARFDQMIALGGVEEAVALSALGLDAELPAMKAIGVAYLSAAHRQEISFDEAIALCKRDTRRYAKRQMTWIRNQMSDWQLFETADSALEAVMVLNSDGFGA